MEKNNLSHQQQSVVPVWIDTDNALGSYFGDIDDAIAIATLFKSGYPVLGVSNVFGNTFQNISYVQTAKLLQLLNVSLPHYAGAETWWSTESKASEALSTVNQKFKILALGPLTNIAAALKKNPDLKNHIEEIIFVGTNYSIQLPNWRFFDFNVFKDKSAATEVIKSGVPLVLIPCDQARKIRFSKEDIQIIKGSLGRFFTENSRRWFRRALWLKFQKSIPVWDLTAVLYLLQPKEFQFKMVKIDQTFLNHIRVKATKEQSHIKTLSHFNTKVKNISLTLLSR